MRHLHLVRLHPTSNNYFAGVLGKLPIKVQHRLSDYPVERMPRHTEKWPMHGKVVYVIDGHIQIVRSSVIGNNAVIATLLSGMLEVTRIQEERPLQEIIYAAERSLIRIFPQEEIWRAIALCPQALEAYTAELLETTIYLQGQVEFLIQGKNRCLHLNGVVHYIAMIARLQGIPLVDGSAVRLPSLEDVGQAVGISRENVSRSLSWLTRAGIISQIHERTSRQIYVLDSCRLYRYL